MRLLLLIKVSRARCPAPLNALSDSALRVFCVFFAPFRPRGGSFLVFFRSATPVLRGPRRGPGVFFLFPAVLVHSVFRWCRRFFSKNILAEWKKVVSLHPLSPGERVLKKATVV